MSETSVVAVIGAVGSGKTTFINLVSGSSFEIGAGINSCTTVIQATSPFLLEEKRMILLDAPGFEDDQGLDDKAVDEGAVLIKVQQFLEETYGDKQTLSGIIYLHNVCRHRVGGLSETNFELIKRLCRQPTLKNVRIVSNFWDDVSSEDKGTRGFQMTQEDAFFRLALAQEAKHIPHNNSYQSACAIIGSILGFIPRRKPVRRDSPEYDEDVDWDRDGTDTGIGLQSGGAYYGEPILFDHSRQSTPVPQSGNGGINERLCSPTDELVDLRGQLRESRKELADLANRHHIEMTERDERIRSREKDLEERKEELRNMRVWMDRAQDRERDLGRMRELLTKKEEECQKSSEQEDELRRQMSKKNSKHKKQIQELRAELTAVRSELEKTQRQSQMREIQFVLDRRDEQIQALNEELRRLKIQNPSRPGFWSRIKQFFLP